MLADCIFSETRLEDAAVVKEYFERNERRKQDENWLKKHKPVIESLMSGKEKADFEEFRVHLITTDASNFDMEKVEQFLLEQKHENLFKRVVDLTLLENAVLEGVVNQDELKKAAWIERVGTPRLTIKRKS